MSGTVIKLKKVNYSKLPLLRSPANGGTCVGHVTQQPITGLRGLCRHVQHTGRKSAPVSARFVADLAARFMRKISARNPSRVHSPGCFLRQNWKNRVQIRIKNSSVNPAIGAVHVN